MRARRTLVSIAAAAVIALAAVVFVSNSPASEPRTALAGPCGAEPELRFSNDSSGAPPRQVIDAFLGPGGTYRVFLDVKTDPETLPEGKPPVTIKVIEVAGHPGIFQVFSPPESNGSFQTALITAIGPDVPHALYEYEIQIDCHGEIAKIAYDVYIGSCPAPSSSGFQISGNGTPTPTPQPFPDTCEEPSPTPSPPPATPTPSPTATAVPTATAAPGQQVTWADNNCKDGVNPVDSLLVLRGDAGLSANTNECPPMGASIEVLLASLHIWGDVDCKDGMSPVDSLKILRFDAGLSVSQEAGCPAMGSAVTIVEL